MHNREKHRANRSKTHVTLLAFVSVPTLRELGVLRILQQFIVQALFASGLTVIPQLGPALLSSAVLVVGPMPGSFLLASHQHFCTVAWSLLHESIRGIQLLEIAGGQPTTLVKKPVTASSKNVKMIEIYRNTKHRQTTLQI